MAHRSIKGRMINMDEIRNSNGSKKALGNGNMNARGDIIKPTGEIVKTREQIIKDYNSSNPNAVRHVSLKDKINSIPVMKADEVVKALNDMKKKQETKPRKLIDKDDE